MMCMMPHMMAHSEHGDTHANTPQLSPSDILKRRFALGELTREQFTEMMHVLSAAETESAHAHHETHKSS